MPSALANARRLKLPAAWAEVELRNTLGHWEGDTVVGSDMRHCTLTLIERASGFGIKCYFATPYHSWERGSHENFNGLLRQYLPKGTCMRSLTQQQCDVIANEFNDRPRKRHNFLSPAEIYFRRHSVALAR